MLNQEDHLYSVVLVGLRNLKPEKVFEIVGKAVEKYRLEEHMKGFTDGQDDANGEND